MKHIIYRIIQWTWGFLQTFCGFLVYLTQRKHPHYGFHGAVVTNWHGHGGSLSLGMFIFLDIDNPRPQTSYENKLLVHEYGHTIQSLFLGPLYLLVVGLPSFIWASCFGKYRTRKHRSYYSFYPEKWANRLGARYHR